MNTKDLPTLAAAIAKEMGDGWHAEPSSMNHLASITDGTLTLNILAQYPNVNRDRVEVCAEFHSGAAYRDDRPSITVSVKRPPAAIAKDITRRLVDAAREYDAACRAALSEHEETERLTKDRVMALAAILHDRDPQTMGRSEVRLSARHQGAWGSFKPNHRGETFRVTLESVPFDVAVRLAELLMSV